LQKCPYCDFASATIRRPEVRHKDYAQAVLAELGARAAALASETLASVFFGGGTPSLWDAGELGRVLDAVRASFAHEVNGLEVTVECNPTSLDRDKARALRAVGVNRLSIGVQSLDDTQLRFLGRLHDASGGLRAVNDALAEMPRVSADLIFGLPEQRPEQAVAQARSLAKLGLRHVSVYGLTIEPNTQFGQLHAKGRLPLAREDDVAESFEQIAAALGAEGFEHYEVSNYAFAGEPSRHNQHYWRGGAYLGLGAGAVGCLQEGTGHARRYRNDPKPERYLVSSGTPAVEVFEESLGPEELVREQLMLGLRTSEGVDLERAANLSGIDPRANRERALLRGIERGELVLDGERLRVPHERWLHLDSIIASIF
jgi:oxygen-independent coproporphyrinogen-3 oxidase